MYRRLKITLTIQITNSLYKSNQENHKSTELHAHKKGLTLSGTEIMKGPTKKKRISANELVT